MCRRRYRRRSRDIYRDYGGDTSGGEGRAYTDKVESRDNMNRNGRRHIQGYRKPALENEAQRITHQSNRRQDRGADATMGPERRLEEVLAKRDELEGKILRKQMMISNKKVQMDVFAEYKGEEGDDQMSRWTEDIHELRREVSQLDTEIDAYERGIMATTANDVEAKANRNEGQASFIAETEQFVAEIKRCAAEMQEGRRLEEKGRAMLKRAEARMVEICE